MAFWSFGLVTFALPSSANTTTGWQYEGIADEPSGEELEHLKHLYYGVYPDGPSRLALPGLIYVRIRPTWRLSAQLKDRLARTDRANMHARRRARPRAPCRACSAN